MQDRQILQTQTIKSFPGINTEEVTASGFSSPEAINFDIRNDNKLQKTKGSRLIYSKLVSDNIIDIDINSTVTITVADNSGFTVGDCSIFEDISDAQYSSHIVGRIWEVDSKISTDQVVYVARDATVIAKTDYVTSYNLTTITQWTVPVDSTLVHDGVANTLTFNPADGSNPNSSLSATLLPYERRYKFTIEVDSITGTPDLIVSVNGVDIETISATGTNIFYYVHSGTAGVVDIRFNGIIGEDIVVSEIRVLDSVSGKTNDQYNAVSSRLFDATGSYGCGYASGDLISSINVYGAIAKPFNGYVYSFIGKDTANFLVKQSIATGVLEAINPTTPYNTFFTNTDRGSIKEYASNVLFCKGQKKIIAAAHGGVLCIKSDNTVVLFGESNNPTGSVLEVHNDRLWVGNLTYIGSGAVANAGSWTMVSKLYPQIEDTVYDITAISVGTRTVVTLNEATVAGVAVGDIVYIDSITQLVGTGALNSKYHTVTEVDDVAKTITIDTNTSGFSDVPVTASGAMTLRGTTWSSSVTLYDDGLTGAGIFKCDDDSFDEIKQLVSSMGALAILRRRSIYIFAGNLATGDISLSRQLNTPYGAASSSYALASKGFWFITDYGLGKIEGVTVKSSATDLDNLLAISASYPIKKFMDRITSKEDLIIQQIDEQVLLHDPSRSETYSVNLINGQWTMHKGRLAEEFFLYEQNAYALSNGLLFLQEYENRTFATSTFSYSDINSSYRFSFQDQGMPRSLKDYKEIRILTEGSANSIASYLTTELYFNGKKSITSLSFQTNIVNASLVLWDSYSSSETFDDIVLAISPTSPATVTFDQLTGDDSYDYIEDHYYDVGTARSIQIRFSHFDNVDLIIDSVDIGYDNLIINEY